MTIDEAIAYLRETYEAAVKNPLVHNPLAFALYKTWRKADEMRGKTNDT